MLSASFWSRLWRLVLRASSFDCAIVFLSVVLVVMCLILVAWWGCVKLWFVVCL